MMRNEPPRNLLLTIRGLLPSLNEQEQKVGQYVLDHPDEVIHLAMVDLAERCGVGDTTIFRFCRRVKTDGYQDFKIALAQELNPRDSLVYEAVVAGDTAAVAAQKAIAGDVKALEDTLRVLDLEALDRAAVALLAARRVDVYGSGGAAVAAQELQYKLLQVGVRAIPHTDAQMQLMSAAMLSPNDVAVGFSHSGTAPDVRQALMKAKERRAVTVAVTNHPASPIARLADISLCTAAQEAAARDYPLGARVAQVGLIDVLYTCLMLKQQAVGTGV
jgi:RpiR family transcriptional regulator, carbohydrate utilization regulator